MSDDDLCEARRWFAEELRFVARIEDQNVVDALATVPRERFVPQGPLRMLSHWNLRDYWTPPGSSPTAVYHDVLIAYDEKRRLNNGQPSLWAFVFDKLHVARGERVVHLGCGMGYYSAVLAELVGPTGKVSAIEIDEPLMERARAALAPWPQVTVINGDGANGSFGESDVVVASAGATHPLRSWLDSLSANGRLVFPMTVTNAGGGMLFVRHAAGATSLRSGSCVRSGSMNLPALATPTSAIVLRKRSLKTGAPASSRFARISTRRSQPAGFTATGGACPDAALTPRLSTLCTGMDARFPSPTGEGLG